MRVKLLRRRNLSVIDGFEHKLCEFFFFFYVSARMRDTEDPGGWKESPASAPPTRSKAARVTRQVSY